MIETKRQDKLIASVVMRHKDANLAFANIQNGDITDAGLYIGDTMDGLIRFLLQDISQSTAWLQAIQQAIKDTTPKREVNV